MKQNETLAVRFTDDDYLTKEDVRRRLGIGLIDDYWRDIMTYRTKFRKDLGFRSVSHQEFFVTLSPGVESKVNKTNEKISNFLKTIANLSSRELHDEVERNVFLNLLEALNQAEDTQMKEISIKALIMGKYAEDNPFHDAVIAHFRALRILINGDVREPDMDFLAYVYGLILGEEELTSFYRQRDFDQTARRAYLQRAYSAEYSYAPYEEIEDLMDGFLNSLAKNEELSPFMRSISALFYLDYVRPFDGFNVSMASLFAKDILASKNDNHAFYLPFEGFLGNRPSFLSLKKEVQRTQDLTYWVTSFCAYLNGAIDRLQAMIANLKIAPYREEALQLDEMDKRRLTQDIRPTYPSRTTTQMSIFDDEEAEIKEDKKETFTPIEEPIVQEQPYKIEEEVPLIHEEEKVKEEKPLTPLAKMHKRDTPPQLSEEEKKKGFHPFERPTLSNKEVKEYARYLLEINPNLNKNQASFYAAHSTPGRYYTIEQFRRFTRCAYETARTSMDKLAQEGYYQKSAVKNKFVYSVPSEDKQ